VCVCESVCGCMGVWVCMCVGVCVRVRACVCECIPIWGCCSHLMKKDHLSRLVLNRRSERLDTHRFVDRESIRLRLGVYIWAVRGRGDLDLTLVEHSLRKWRSRDRLDHGQLLSQCASSVRTADAPIDDAHPRGLCTPSAFKRMREKVTKAWSAADMLAKRRACKQVLSPKTFLSTRKNERWRLQHRIFRQELGLSPSRLKRFLPEGDEMY
jgi:hypothetical protein